MRRYAFPACNARAPLVVRVSRYALGCLANLAENADTHEALLGCNAGRLGPALINPSTARGRKFGVARTDAAFFEVDEEDEAQDIAKFHEHPGAAQKEHVIMIRREAARLGANLSARLESQARARALGDMHLSCDGRANHLSRVSRRRGSWARCSGRTSRPACTRAAAGFAFAYWRAHSQLRARTQARPRPGGRAPLRDRGGERVRHAVVRPHGRRRGRRACAALARGGHQRARAPLRLPRARQPRDRRAQQRRDHRGGLRRGARALHGPRGRARDALQRRVRARPGAVRACCVGGVFANAFADGVCVQVRAGQARDGRGDARGDRARRRHRARGRARVRARMRGCTSRMGAPLRHMHFPYGRAPAACAYPGASRDGLQVLGGEPRGDAGLRAAAAPRGGAAEPPAHRDVWRDHDARARGPGPRHRARARGVRGAM